VTAPTVSVSAPGAGSTVSGTLTVTAAASDDVGLAGVQFLLDGAPLGSEDTAAPFSASWNTTTTSNGAHSLAARARDAAGNTTTSVAISVLVSNSAIPPDLVAAYGFDEASGTSATDASGRGHTATISGAVWTSGGKYGSALAFDGMDDSATVADTSALDLTTGLTIEAWVRPTALAGWRTVVLKERSSGLSYALYASDDASRASGFVRRSSDVGVVSPAALPLNSWTHLAVTYDGATLRLYVNGNQVRSRTQTGAVVTSSNALKIGGNSVWGEYFAGLIDDVRIYSKALTVAEIRSDMNTPVGSAGN
jgi:hypothetical protein